MDSPSGRIQRALERLAMAEVMGLVLGLVDRRSRVIEGLEWMSG